MYTLQDFLTLTKGQEYLIAVGSMILFGVFWLLFDRESPKEDRDQAPQNKNATKHGSSRNA